LPVDVKEKLINISSLSKRETSGIASWKSMISPGCTPEKSGSLPSAIKMPFFSIRHVPSRSFKVVKYLRLVRRKSSPPSHWTETSCAR
jgi:hypothetical protein